MGNIESLENIKEIDNSKDKDKDNLKQQNINIENIPIQHPNTKYFSKKGIITSEDTINTDYQDGITSNTSLNTLID